MCGFMHSLTEAMWILKSPTMITLSDLRSKLDKNSENSFRNSEYGTGAWYTSTNITGCNDLHLDVKDWGKSFWMSYN